MTSKNYQKYKECYQRYYLKNRDQILNRIWEYNQRTLQDPILRLWKASKASAKVRGLEHTISKSDIVIPEYCPILEIKLYLGIGEGHRHDSPSIDRIDNSRGYIPGNVWVISRKANSMKFNASQEELLLFSKNICRLFENGYLKVCIPPE